ncbi:EAL domain-containing protein [Ramlibacter sp. H39-3-26]|uniref:sensor domain-containing protein n=1 Tax=Curvibacter soli TaxID=3031331 RepID=UPI0023DB4C35|nr:EAL domain-containing protein [Ramlibacter sp. H39-3-26]MDF1485334.1 EAL domain-containing protein [Ramlibacter sp. H39-3-26]
MTFALSGPLVEGLLEAVVMVDAQSLRIRAANAAAARLTGLPQGDLPGLPVASLLAAPEDAFFWEEAAAGLADTLYSYSQLVRPDGEVVYVERRVSQAALDDGTPVFLLAMTDRTEQQRTEDELEKLVSELRATLDSTADGILVCGPDGAVRGFNQRFAGIWAVPADLLLRRDDSALAAFLASRVIDAPRYRQRLAEIEAAPALEATDVLALHGGRLVQRVTLPQRSRGRPIGRVYSFRDITEATAAEAGLRLAAQVFESSLDAIFIAGPDHRVLQVNPALAALVGEEAQALLRRDVALLVRRAEPGDIYSGAEAAWKHHGFWDAELLLARADGSSCPVHLSWVALRDADGALTQSVGFLRDLTQQHAAHRRIEELAYTDALTGLPNRTLLSQRVEFALRVAQREGACFAMLFMDLDRFKNINDSLGHAFGDRVLRMVAARLQGGLREVDTLCRLGGDEFVIHLHGADAQAAETAARRILDQMRPPFALDDVEFSLGCSIGIALFPQDGPTLDDLIRHADTAMYRVKDSGRNSFGFYQPQMNANLLPRIKMEHDLHRALELGQLRLHYQPQLSLRTNRIVGVEALIRWHDPERGNVPPGEFIPLAEESGSIVPIGAWVLQEAVGQAARWLRQGMPVPVSVNVSALQFRQSDFVDTVAVAIAMAELPPELLELELTESILIQDANEVLERLRLLAQLGVRLSIDDFGTGYSSLAYLKRFPIHKLKIDQSFVRGLPGDAGDSAIVSAIVSIGRALRMDVIAEGVETEVQRDALVALGCSRFQGFLCAPGLPAAEFERMLRAMQRGHDQQQ